MKIGRLIARTIIGGLFFGQARKSCLAGSAGLGPRAPRR